MKKFIRTIIVLALVFSNINVAVASEQERKVEETMQPQYETVDEIKTVLNISSGTATLKLRVKPANSAINKVVTTISLIKNSTGKSVAKWIDVRMQGPDLREYYYIDDYQYVLKDKGIYHFTAEIKLYQGSVLKETVHTTSENDTY